MEELTPQLQPPACQHTLSDILAYVDAIREQKKAILQTQVAAYVNAQRSGLEAPGDFQLDSSQFWKRSGLDRAMPGQPQPQAGP